MAITDAGLMLQLSFAPDMGRYSSQYVRDRSHPSAHSSARGSSRHRARPTQKDASHHGGQQHM